jgi:hypothetical protein
MFRIMCMPPISASYIVNSNENEVSMNHQDDLIAEENAVAESMSKLISQEVVYDAPGFKKQEADEEEEGTHVI